MLGVAREADGQLVKLNFRNGSFTAEVLVHWRCPLTPFCTRNRTVPSRPRSRKETRTTAPRAYDSHRCTGTPGRLILLPSSQGWDHGAQARTGHPVDYAKPLQASPGRPRSTTAESCSNLANAPALRPDGDPDGRPSSRRRNVLPHPGRPPRRLSPDDQHRTLKTGNACAHHRHPS